MIGEVGGAPPVAMPAAGGGELAGNSAMGKDEFLQLLVAQLRNQDPMNPANPEEFASQLAQFSSLEQLLDIREAIEGQAAVQDAVLREIHGSTAMGLVGKEVLAAGNGVDVTGGGDESVTVGVAQPGGSAVIRVLNVDGQVVGEREVGFVGAGRQEVALGAAAEGLEPGAYRYEVEVVDAQGAPVEVQRYQQVVVDGVLFGPSGPVLVSGGREIPLADVVQVSRGTNHNAG